MWCSVFGIYYAVDNWLCVIWQLHMLQRVEAEKGIGFWYSNGSRTGE